MEEGAPLDPSSGGTPTASLCLGEALLVRRLVVPVLNKLLQLPLHPLAGAWRVRSRAPSLFQHVPTDKFRPILGSPPATHDYFSWPSDSNPCCPGPTSPSLWLRTPVYQRGQAVRGRATARVMAARAGRTCSLSVHKSLPQHRSLTSFTGMGSLAALNTFQIRACSNHG